MEGRHREEEEDMDVDTRQERIKPTLTGHTLGKFHSRKYQVEASEIQIGLIY